MVSFNSMIFHTHSDNESKAFSKLIKPQLQTEHVQVLLALHGQADIANNWQAERELENNKWVMVWS